METSEPHVETDTSPPLPPPEEVILTHVENENNHNNVEITIAADAEGSIPAVQTEVAEVQATTVVQFACKPSDEVAALKIQTAFRGYMVCYTFFI